MSLFVLDTDTPTLFERDHAMVEIKLSVMIID
jgi:hypothetical protein